MSMTESFSNKMCLQLQFTRFIILFVFKGVFLLLISSHLI